MNRSLILLLAVFFATLPDALCDGEVKAEVDVKIHTMVKLIEGEGLPEFANNHIDLAGLTIPDDTEADSPWSVAGVLTDRQLQVVVHAIDLNENIEFVAIPSLVTRGGDKATIEVIKEEGDEDLAFHIDPVGGSDPHTIDINIQAGSEESSVTTPITTWDRQTTVMAKRRKDGSLCLAFITSRLVDPAGRPIHPYPAPRQAR